ncbi:PREDICTED: tRNA-dihydrouridine(47) synthase [NAD(P)(+)]-like [Nicotiana attenuata]|uniref:tRNA-dihydrouridine(47) synthase [NAD(P)(+)] n=1 Tax=Nicotiana attenuata TaxID=49451 RepID=A0A1J6KZ46_NICAT|nr:PREDICTED: tRNA-dihydrouridine(47) synthase [NAD(P)(+)]-like [Nicotiana attenuata]OIT27939.1 trna-dihydrouridine(47) synthase [nad(p)(+)]-like protein [Nicotiana attenuata]
MENETLTDSSPAATATEQPEAPVQQSSSNIDYGEVNQPFRTPEELVAKAIAPVKREYIRPPPSRPSNNNNNNGAVGVENDDAAEVKSAPILKEKKSKRQIKRERRQEQKSPLHICPEVAKTGKVSACPYSDKCRFSHDLEAFKAEKPADIEGSCPFLVYEGPCPYGLACRFAGTHEDDVSAQTEKISRKSSELNFFNKDTQKLLWKNKMKFPKAEATLKLLGLEGHPKDKILVDKEENGEVVPKEPATDTKTDSNEAASDCSNKVEITPSISPEDDVVENNMADDIRPLKKAKSSIDEICSSQASNGSSVQGEVLDSNCDVNKSDPTAGMVTDSDKSLKLHPREKKLIDFRDKLYLAPLTTVGNLPFRRVCKVLGADVTSGEMAMCTNLLQGQASEWALLRRHSSENLFGVQICGAYPDTVTKTVELIEQECSVDFIDINMGCPIDIVVNKGAGSALLTKPMRMKSVVKAASATVDIPVTIKVRTAYFEGKNRIDSLIADIGNWGATAVTIHGRSRQQRYSKLADWDYIYQCVQRAPKSLQVLGNGDVFSYLDWNKHKTDSPELSTCMIARGALIKPWIFTEIKEQRHWDITSGERLDILKDYARFGLEHWGSDSKGVETTRHFLLEWLSYTCRYVPVGLLEIIPQRINWRPPSYYGRDDLETLMASDSAADWIRISEMLLGKVPAGFSFAPKHKSNAYDRAENG